MNYLQVCPNPWMVTHHPKDKDGHSASPGCSPISLRLVTHYPKSPSQIWSPSFQRMATQNPWDGPISTKLWALGPHHPKDCHQASIGWSPMIPSMVTNHPKLIKCDKTLRNSNQTWSLTLAQASLLTNILFQNIFLLLQFDSLYLFHN